MTTTELTIVCDEVVDACAPWSAIVRAGQTLQIIDLHGNQAVDTLLYGVSGDQADHTLRYSAQATVAAQRNIFLSTGSVLRAANGTPLMTIVADDVGNHDTIAGSVLQGVQHAALRPSHRAPTRLCRELFGRGRQVGTGQARHRVEHQLLHERAGGGRRHTRHRRRTVGAGQVADAARRAGHAGAGIELPADQQPLQRVRPDPSADGDSAR